jgi:hypothetical protein
MKYRLKYKTLSLASGIRFLLLHKPEFILDASWETSCSKPFSFRKLIETSQEVEDDQLISGAEFARLASRYYSWEEFEAARFKDGQLDFDYFLDQGHPVIYRTDDEEIVKLLTLLELSDASDLDEIEWGLKESLINYADADTREFTFASIDPLLLLRTLVKLEEPMIEGSWEILTWRADSVHPSVKSRPDSDKPTAPDLLEAMIFVKSVEEITLVRRGENGSELMRLEFKGESARAVMPISPHSDFLANRIQNARSKPYIETMEEWNWDRQVERQEVHETAEVKPQFLPGCYGSIMLAIALALGVYFNAETPHDLREDASWRLIKSSSGPESVCIQPGIEARQVQRITAEWKTVNDLQVTVHRRLFFNQPVKDPILDICFSRPDGTANEGRQEIPTVRKVGRGGRLSLITEVKHP